MSATHMQSPIGPLPIRRHVIKEMEGKTDREIADGTFVNGFIDPEYFAELCHRGLSGPGWFQKDTYTEIERREKRGLEND